MNVSQLGQGIKSVVKDAASGAARFGQTVTNKVESGLAKVPSWMLPSTGSGGNNPFASKPFTSQLALLSNSLRTYKPSPATTSTPPVLQAPGKSSFMGDLMGGGIDPASGASLRTSQDVVGKMMGKPSMPMAPQTTGATANTVSPAALNAAQPSSVRSGNAVVPTPPAAPAGGMMPSQTPMPSMMQAPISAPRPASADLNSSGYGAAIPTSALLRILAQSPNREGAGAYVTSPEALQLGSRPRRKTRDSSI